MKGRVKYVEVEFEFVDRFMNMVFGSSLHGMSIMRCGRFRVRKEI